MARKTGSEAPAAGDGAAEATRQAIEKQRLMWAGIFIVAVALFAGGYAIGSADPDLAIVGADTVTAQPAATAQGQAPGRGVGQGRGAAAHTPGAGAGLGPDGSGAPGGGNVDRVPGQGPRGQNFPGECPFGISQPESGDEIPTFSPGFLGIGVQQTPTGVLVTEVRAGAPGAVAGIRVDDVIVDFDGTAVDTVGQFAQLVRFAGAGTEVQLSFVRSGIEMTARVVLGDIPA